MGNPTSDIHHKRPAVIKILEGQVVLNSNSGGPVNWDSAIDAVGGDRQLLLDIIDAFLSDSKRQFESLKGAIQRADFVTARRAAHTLKGNCRYFGAQACVDLAFEIEEQTRQGAVKDPQESLTKLEALLDGLNSCLLDYVKLEGGNSKCQRS